MLSYATKYKPGSSMFDIQKKLDCARNSVAVCDKTEEIHLYFA